MVFEKGSRVPACVYGNIVGTMIVHIEVLLIGERIDVQYKETDPRVFNLKVGASAELRQSEHVNAADQLEKTSRTEGEKVSIKDHHNTAHMPSEFSSAHCTEIAFRFEGS